MSDTIRQEVQLGLNEEVEVVASITLGGSQGVKADGSWDVNQGVKEEDGGDMLHDSIVRCIDSEETSGSELVDKATTEEELDTATTEGDVDVVSPALPKDNNIPSKPSLRSRFPFGKVKKNVSIKEFIVLWEEAVDENQNKQNQLTAGCNCKKSACLVKFCVCVQNRTQCGPLCKCYNCSYQPGNQPKQKLKEKSMRFL